MTKQQQLGVLTTLQNVISFNFHHGDCIGSDEEAHDIARGRGGNIIIHPPNIAKKRAFCKGDHIYPPYPYLDRNKYIVVLSQIMIAAPKETNDQLRSGTWFTIRYAHRMQKPLIIINPKFVFIERGDKNYDAELRRIINAMQRVGLDLEGDTKEIQETSDRSSTKVFHKRKQR